MKTAPWSRAYPLDRGRNTTSCIRARVLTILNNFMFNKNIQVQIFLNNEYEIEGLK